MTPTLARIERIRRELDSIRQDAPELLEIEAALEDATTAVEHLAEALGVSEPDEDEDEDA